MLFTAGVHSQSPEFRHLTINDGLSQNAVFAITQDHKGFMWFGTKDGLNRYDGQTFKVFQHNPTDSTSISGNYIQALHTDLRGWVWAGTLESGLNYYQPEKDQFSSLDHLDGLSDNLAQEQITSISSGIHGTLWVGTATNGLYKIDRDKEKGIPISVTNYSKEDGLSNNYIYEIYVDKNGETWVGTDRNVSKYQPERDSFLNYEIEFDEPNQKDYLFYYAIDGIHEGPDNKLWLGTTEGLVLFNKSTGATERFSYQEYANRDGYNRIRRIAEDLNGNLWLATPSELTIFNPVTFEYKSYTSDPSDASSISFDSITALFKSRNGLMWIGTAGMGIDIYDPKSNRFPTLTGIDHLPDLSNFSIREIIEDRNGDVWIISHRPYRWKRNEQTLENVNNLFIPDEFPRPYEIEIWDLIEGSQGNLWAATTHGLIEYDPTENQADIFEYSQGNKDGLPQREVYGVFEDSGGKIWAITENYLSNLIDRETGSFKNYRYNPNESIREQIRPVLTEEKSGNFWIGTSYGLSYFDKFAESFLKFEHDSADPNSLSHNLVKSILPDPNYPDRFLWIGTSGGLNKMDIQSKEFTHYTTADGLPNNVIYAILPDDSGHLWVSTNRGLSKFHPEEMNFRNYDVHDGLQSNEFNTGAYFRSSSGELYFGGISGLNYFYPDRVTDNPNPPEIALTGFEIDGREITFQESKGILDSPLTSAQNIQVSHNDDVLAFQFAALDFSAPEKNQYAYKLEGLSENWIESGNYASAVFTNIPHGEYSLRIKASNNDGIWNEAGIGIGLIVTPPWWQTWWAYFIYLVIFLGAGYSLRRYELNRYNLKNQLELERVQTESLRKLDHLKSEFFANISHEFRTPLSLILGQIENVLTSDIDRKDKRKLEMATQNANRLLTLINQLLDLSKLESGKMKMNNDQHNIVSFLKSLLYSFETLAESKEIRLLFNSDSDWIPVIFDSEKMERVFLNLITNAFKFTPAGGEIGVEVKQINDDNIEIRVKDTGIGIPADHIKNIFDRFYQADSSSTRPYEGTGIGLALVNEFVKLHNGKIEVQSRFENETGNNQTGTVFIIHLPTDRVEKDFAYKVDAIRLSHHEFESEVSKSVTKHVDLNLISSNLDKEILLIVEDNAEVREFIREQLEEDYRILEAENGVQGIELSQEEIPDLIISDLMMPEMDGYDFCKQIRKDEKTSHIPVIMLTAKAGLEDKLKGFETGIDAYLTKPFKVKELQVRVRKLIQQRRQLRDQFSEAGLIQTKNVTDDSIEKVFLEKAISVVESNFSNEQFKVNHLAGSLNMSPGQLNRKLQALVDQSAVQFIISVRLQHAAKQLREKNKTIAEISYEVGYNDQAYFTRVFKKQFGVSPSEFRKN
ncbi:hybrid sensor histidine kinase/response regulator transcription factor [Rhodohalobacter sulfatireducens]|uniref:histidine kinase n=1 Tax=Rhodohalobacter sulfatireducens TaxID=2911366 RepID=A0ABS9KIN0_9BACT|nr:hybrid sensor histidine kinase/response regulator transcription factor [Rhodohalobacter sulfatireducens]MCG2590647.1 response regulator [Rhodohalobacter sulfatireducens]